MVNLMCVEDPSLQIWPHMSNIDTDIFWLFCDVTKQNGHASVRILYREQVGVVLWNTVYR